MYHVLIDGDNIQWETFVDRVKDKIEIAIGKKYFTTIFCQTHVLIKFRPLSDTNLRIRTARTTNKNASDARLLLEIGKLSADPNAIILVVSNDKIFEEVVDNRKIFLFGYESVSKRTTIRKKVVINAMKDFPEPEVNLSDLFEKINCKSISVLRDYINKFIPNMWSSPM